MKVVVLVIGFLIAAPGLIFFLQGINILPGSFMTGDPKWAYIGATMLVIGGGMLVLGIRNMRSGQQS